MSSDISANLSSLLVSEGGADEPAEGPAAFDVFDDGSILIADPLRNRLTVFSANGDYQREIKIGFPADDLTITRDRLILVRQATTGEMRLVDQEGRAHPLSEGMLPRSAEAELTGKNRATVTFRGDNSGRSSLLQVKFEKPGLTLVSIEGIAIDQDGSSYVALEATGGGEGVDVVKYVRKYSAEGKLIGEIGDIPLDYFISPVDELRARKGIVYQLKTTPSEIQINEWDVRQ